MLLGTSALRRWEAEGRRKEDLPFVHWSLQTALSEIQRSFEGIVANFPGFLGLPIRFFGPLSLRLAPLGSPPSDRLHSRVASLITVAGEQRERLTSGTWIARDEAEPGAAIDRAFRLLHDAAPAIQKIQAARKEKKLPKGRIPQLVGQALEQGILSSDEANLIKRLEAAREEVLAVDEFEPDGTVAGSEEKRRPAVMVG